MTRSLTIDYDDNDTFDSSEAELRRDVSNARGHL